MKRPSHLRLAASVALGLGLGSAVALTVFGDAFAEPPKEGPPRAGWAPDPTPVASKKQWVFDISVKQGVMDVPTVKAVELKKAQATPRMMGRYAIELYIGTELLDRIRFNVPGAGDGPRDEDRRPLKGPRTDRVTTQFQVRIADNPRATSARFVDRASGEVRVVAWPPTEGKLVFLDDAGTRTDGGAPAPSTSPDGGPPVNRPPSAADIGRVAFEGTPRDAGPPDAKAAPPSDAKAPARDAAR